MTAKSILIVDDSLVDRMKLSLAVKALGHEVSEAKDGQEALDAVGRQQFDLILLDLLMPGMDGFETLRQLRASDSAASAPTVVVSSLEDENELQRATELGAVAHLRKPFAPAELAQVLKFAR